MTDSEEKLNGTWLPLINILLLKNPERTVLGVLLGVVISFLSRLFSPLLETIKIMDIGKAPSWGWIPLGIVIINLSNIFTSTLTKPRINEEIDNISKLIEDGSFSASEKRQVYRSLINACLKNVTLKKDFTDELNKMQKDLFS
jgi:hypothetical protein